jgi:pyridoxine 4-dehydrogenase
MQTIELAGKTIPRMGYGTMRLPGKGVTGPPEDYDEAIRVLKKVIELGIRAIDTAWYYGPNVANQLVAEALHPYPEDLVFITKLGGKRDEQGNWLPANTPDELKEGMENDLKLLKVESVSVVHLRWMGSETVEDNFKKAVDAMLEMKQAGKFKELGLSTVGQEQLDYVLGLSKVATVSNQFSLSDHHDDAMVDRCAEDGIAYLPYFPLAVGKSGQHEVLQKWAEKLGVSGSQVAIAWLLKRSPTILPIPGTSSVAHLKENFAAGDIELPQEAFDEISNI